MTKNKKIEYINAVNDRFLNARNHGRQGNNWWYPTANTIAYNVKLYSWPDLKEQRAIMSKRQNEYYSDDDLNRNHDEFIGQQCEWIIEDLKVEGAFNAGFSGRSGGWLEVEYNNLLREIDESADKDEINGLYQEAKKLESLEVKICELIKKRHAWLLKYIGSKEYYADMLENLRNDDDIADIYKSQAEALINKLK